MNIMDGMDAARYTSGNPDNKSKKKQAKKDAQTIQDPVLRNLNNK
ncbi:hypothetical protein [Paenibacillus sedimenti]|nr:hypothetical protein [Paenibacillus sedimenti]